MLKCLEAGDFVVDVEQDPLTGRDKMHLNAVTDEGAKAMSFYQQTFGALAGEEWEYVKKWKDEQEKKIEDAEKAFHSIMQNIEGPYDFLFECENPDHELLECVTKISMKSADVGGVSIGIYKSKVRKRTYY